MNTRPKPTTAFVFGGGGRWGAVEVGMLEALVDWQIMPHFIVGTSIGAMNGAVFAAEPNAIGLERLRTLWKQVADKGFGGSVRTRLRNLAGLRSAIYPVEPIRELLEESLDVSRIEDLAVAFLMRCVVHRESGGTMVLRGRSRGPFARLCRHTRDLPAGRN